MQNIMKLKVLSRRNLWIVLCTMLLAIRGKAQTSSVSVPTDDEIRRVLVERVDSSRESVGMVVGIITPDGRRIISYGHLEQGDQRTPDGNTVFEIGSDTKIFTALLLADMVRRGEVSLEDPVAKFLPSGVVVPERNGRKITLVDLATQTSGLPFWPTGIPADYSGAAMMAKYSAQDLYKFLSGYELKDDIGTKWAYSNLGFGLLGHALSLRAGKEYEALIRERINGPLGMNSTAIILSPEMKANYGVGHDASLNPAPDWNVPLLEGCGSLRSTTNDLLTFIGAFMGIAHSPLDSAMALMTTVSRPGPQLTQTLGWWLTFEQGDDCVVTHPGCTFGYSSVVAYDPKMRVGVVVLSNSIGGDVGSIAWHILRPQVWPWTTKAKERKEIVIDSNLLELYVGTYQAAAGVLITIEHDSSGLLIKTPATPPEGLRLHAERERDFFVEGIDLQISFDVDQTGKVDGLVVHFGGNDTPATRIEPASNTK